MNTEGYIKMIKKEQVFNNFMFTTPKRAQLTWEGCHVGSREVEREEEMERTPEATTKMRALSFLVSS